MPYHEMMVKPMRDEVTRLGVKELRTIAEVDEALGPGEGTVMVFVNSVCGCAAGAARPALTRALEHSIKPQHLYTVFAGQDLDARVALVPAYASHPAATRTPSGARRGTRLTRTGAFRGRQSFRAPITSSSGAWSAECASRCS